jgi:hypothetical protein
VSKLFTLEPQATILIGNRSLMKYSSVDIMAVSITLALAGAVALVVRGLLGYRAGSHPLCRRCGFDLFGLPTGTTICNECGGSLVARHAVVIGHRHRRTLSLLCGLGLIVPLLVIGISLMWAQVKHVDLWTYAPDSFLLHEARSTNAGTRRKALAEATRRLNQNQLNAQQIEQMVDTCLSYQADRTVAWDPLWGDWIESCQTAGKLTVEQWNRYLTQGMKDSFKFKLRPRIHSGDPLAWVLQSDGRRAGNSSGLQLGFKDIKIDWMTASGNVPQYLDRTFGWNSFGGGNRVAFSSYLNNNPSLSVPMDVGTQRFVLHAIASVGPFANGKVQPTVSEKLELFASTGVVSEAQPTMDLVDRPDLAPAVRQSLNVQILPGTKQPTPVLRITVNNPPFGLSFDVFVRTNGVESRSGSIACPEGAVDRQWGVEVPGFSLGGKGVDIILRSSVTPGLNSIEPLKAWKGEIVFKNVK